MKNRKITLKKIFANLDAIITGVTLSICVIIVNMNVLMRYFLKKPIQGTEEIVTGLFVWTVFIGSAYAYRKHAHLGVDIIIDRLKGRTKLVVTWVIAILELAILVMLTTVSSQYVYHLLYLRGSLKIAVTDVLRLPQAYTGVAVPIGFGISTIYSIYFILTDRLHLIKRKKPAGAQAGPAAIEAPAEGGNAQ